jgi:hypothetical protein
MLDFLCKTRICSSVGGLKKRPRGWVAGQHDFSMLGHDWLSLGTAGASGSVAGKTLAGRTDFGGADLGGKDLGCEDLGYWLRKSWKDLQVGRRS